MSVRRPQPTKLLMILMIVVALGVLLRNHDERNLPTVARAAMEPFDPAAPGRGLDLYRNQVEEHAMAYGLYASAASILGMVEEARIAADWLVKNPADPTTAGWGLPYAWDAFGDGSTNPGNAVYGVTTALAVRGLLDVFEVTGKETYLQTAAAALDAYKKFFHSTPYGGFFGYSNQPNDQIDVHNVSAVLMGQYARAARHYPRRGYRELAQKAKSHLDATRLNSKSNHYWPYSATGGGVNDLVHATYIVQGYIDYARYSEPSLKITGELGHLCDFFEGESIREFPRTANLPEDRRQLPARAWGVGMLVYTLADGGKIDAAREAVAVLQHYEKEGNVFGTTADRNEFVPRVQAHVALGLAKLASHTLGNELRR